MNVLAIRIFQHPVQATGNVLNMITTQFVCVTPLHRGWALIVHAMPNLPVLAMVPVNLMPLVNVMIGRHQRTSTGRVVRVKNVKTIGMGANVTYAVTLMVNIHQM